MGDRDQDPAKDVVSAAQGGSRVTVNLYMAEGDRRETMEVRVPQYDSPSDRCQGPVKFAASVGVAGIKGKQRRINSALRHLAWRWHNGGGVGGLGRGGENEGSDNCGVWVGCEGWIGVTGISMGVAGGTRHTIRRKNGERADQTKTRQDELPGLEG